MYGSVIHKSDLYEFISNKPNPIGFKAAELFKSYTPKLKTDEYLICWLKKPRGKKEKPNIIAANETKLRELLAHLSTYQREFEPTTAFFRILDTETLRTLSLRNSGFKNREKILESFTGLTIAETAMQANRGNNSLAEVSTQACLSSQSYIFAQAFSLGLPLKQVDQVMFAWEAVRNSISSSKNLRIPFNQSKHFYRFIYRVLTQDYFISNDRTHLDLMAHAINKAIRGFSPLEAISKELDFLKPEVFRLLKFNLDSKENRVSNFDKLLDLLSNEKNRNQEINEFVLGLVLSEMSSGDFKYSQLSQDLNKHYPIAILWFALFSSLSQNSNMLPSGNSLGHHIYEKLLNLKEAPNVINADIGVHEFLMTKEFMNKKYSFRREHSNLLKVELFPSLIGTFRYDSSPNAQHQDTRSRFKKPDRLQQKKMRELFHTLDKAQSILHSLERDAQRDLFSD